MFRQTLRLVPLVWLVSLLLTGCFGSKSGPVRVKEKPAAACRSYTHTYPVTQLTVPVLAKKELGRCATITGLAFTMIDTYHNGNPEAFGGVVGKEKLEDWVIFFANPEGSAVSFTVFAPPRLAEKIVALQGLTPLKIKGRYSGNILFGYEIGTQSAITGTRIGDQRFILADDVLINEE